MNQQELLKTIILGFFIFFFLQLHFTGDILLYLNPKYLFISQIGIAFFILLTGVQVIRLFSKESHVCEDGCTHTKDEKWTYKNVISYSVLIFPLVTGLNFSPSILDGVLASQKGSPFFADGNDSEENLGEDDTLPDEENRDDTIDESIDDNTEFIDDSPPIQSDHQITQAMYDLRMSEIKSGEKIYLTEDIYLDVYEDMHYNMDAYIGQEIQFSGYVYKEDGFSPDQFVVARFTITHCLADAYISGLLVKMDNASDFSVDDWIEVTGIISKIDYNGTTIPYIKVTDWRMIEEPKSPYVYPVAIVN